jgi:Putative peptidoglycan binding domain
MRSLCNATWTSLLRPRLAAIVLGVFAASCAGPAVRAPAPVKAEAAPAILSDSHAIAGAQRILALLGYEIGSPDGRIGSETEKAVRAYQKDEKLPADGRLTALLGERLKAARAKLPGKSWAPKPDLTVVYNEGPAETLQRLEGKTLIWQTADGTRLQRPVNFLLVDGADAPDRFLQPLRPGSTGAYRVTRGELSGEVRCTVGRLTRIAVPAGSFDAIEALCREEIAGLPPVERHFTYAPALRLVIREETRTGGQDSRIRELVALRPATAAWPRVAQLGLDWAVSHALEDTAAEDPVVWSSSAVKERFAIHVDRAQPMVLPAGSKAGGLCLRYAITRTDGLGVPYPGLACRSDKGSWVIPSATPVNIAKPPQAAEADPQTLAR